MLEGAVALATQDPADRIIVALDCPKRRALKIAELLEGHARFLKVGMTLFYEAGPMIVRDLERRGFKVFVDLKFHDIPHQVEGAAQSVARLGVQMMTAHASGGRDMLAAAARGAAVRPGAQPLLERPAMLAITVLTSMDQGTLDQIGVTRPIDEQVASLASLAKESGMDGVVCSPLEAAAMREALGPEAFIVTPGVRPAWSATGDQSRIATPAAAIEAGASHIVVGRPITQAEYPIEAFDAVLGELRG